MATFLAETLAVLSGAGKQTSDVVWVGSPNFGYTDWANFAAVADADYVPTWGLNTVASDLMIVGDSWWLERQSSEMGVWWEYKTLPHKPAQERRLLYAIDNQSPHAWSVRPALIELHDGDDE